MSDILVASSLDFGMVLPLMPQGAATPAFSSTTIDATGEQTAIVGQVFFPARSGSKSIERVGFRFGTVVKAGGSALTVSLQDVSLTTGPPGQPDGTQDQTVAIANANASFVSNTWIRTGVLSANRSVAFGERLAIVIEFDGAGRLGSDSVQVNGIAAAAIANNNGINVLNTGSWALSTSFPNIVLEFSDGTFGSLAPDSYCASAITTNTFNSGSNPSERALEFSVPFSCYCDGGWVWINASANADFTLRLYDGTSVLDSLAVDYNTLGAGAAGRPYPFLWPIPQFLTANIAYRLTVAPTTGNNVTVYSWTVNDANQFVAFAGGNAMTSATRNGGAWTTSPTIRLFAGVFLSGIVTGGGSGVKIHPGMAGGMRG